MSGASARASSRRRAGVGAALAAAPRLTVVHDGSGGRASRFVKGGEAAATGSGHARERRAAASRRGAPARPCAGARSPTGEGGIALAQYAVRASPPEQGAHRDARVADALREPVERLRQDEAALERSVDEARRQAAAVVEAARREAEAIAATARREAEREATRLRDAAAAALDAAEAEGRAAMEREVAEVGAPVGGAPGRGARVDRPADARGGSVILPMERVEVVGPRELLPSVLELLQARGVLELRQAEPGLRRSEADPRAAARRLASTRSRAARPRWPPGCRRRAATSSRRRSRRSTRRRSSRGWASWSRRCRCSRRAARRSSRSGRPPRASPTWWWRSRRSPTGSTRALEPELHGLVLRTDPAALALLEGEVRRLSGGACEVKARPLDAERTGVLVVVPRSCGRALTALLFERGVDEIRLPAAYTGKRLLDVLLLLVARERALPGEVAAVEAALSALADAAGPAPRPDGAAAARGARAARRGGRAAARPASRSWRAATCRAEGLEALRERRARGARRSRRGLRAAAQPRRVARGAGGAPEPGRASGPSSASWRCVALPRYGSTDPDPVAGGLLPALLRPGPRRRRLRRARDLRGAPARAPGGWAASWAATWPGWRSGARSRPPSSGCCSARRSASWGRAPGCTRSCWTAGAAS